METRGGSPANLRNPGAAAQDPDALSEEKIKIINSYLNNLALPGSSVIKILKLHPQDSRVITLVKKCELHFLTDVT
jgi:hypothetical protein